MIYYDFVLSSLYTCSTVKPPLTATSLQWPLIFVLPESPKIGSCLNLSTTQWPLQCIRLTTKITSRQRPVFSATDEKVKNGHQI